DKCYAYGMQAVAADRALHERIWFLSDAEQKVWVLDASINDRGVYTDGELLAGALRIAEEAEAEIAREIIQVTGGAVTSISQVDRLIVWLAARDCVVTDVRKDTMRRALARKDVSPHARPPTELRLAAL